VLPIPINGGFGLVHYALRAIKQSWNPKLVTVPRSRHNGKNWNRAKPHERSRNVADPGKFGVFVKFKWGSCLHGFEKYHPLLVPSAKDVQNHEDTQLVMGTIMIEQKI